MLPDQGSPLQWLNVQRANRPMQNFLPQLEELEKPEGHQTIDDLMYYFHWHNKLKYRYMKILYDFLIG